MTTGDEVSAVVDAIRVARTAGRDPFLMLAEPSHVYAAWLLSIAIDLSRDEIISLMRETWPHVAEPEVAVDHMLRLPFIQATEDGWRLIPGKATSFASEFARQSPSEYRRAHELLARMEASREESSPEEAWFVRGRMAFYLSRVDPEAAVGHFDDGFLTAPVTNRTGCRLWLAHLVMRQEDALDEDSRTALFYRGFRAYVTGRRDEALTQFDEVISDSELDMYAAVALLLSSVILRSRDPSESVARASRARELGSSLGLIETEVMATDALVWAYTERARGERERQERTEGLSSALEMAEINARRAGTDGDEGLLAWAELTAAAVRWLQLCDHRRSVEGIDAEDINGLAGAFRDVRQRFLEVENREGALMAANFAAQMFRDVGDHSAAVGELEYFDPWLDWLGPELPVLERMGKTLGSILSSRPDPDVAYRAGRMLDRINARRG